MTTLMSIGEFALATGLSVKALRFYDDRGLLAPVDVDPHSGYRRYAPAQVRPAAQIRVLRTAGLTVEDVRAALDAPDRLPALLAESVETLRRRRDLEDRALALADAQLAADPDAVPAGREREAPATAWVGVATEIEVGPNLDADTANGEADEQFAALGRAVGEAGLRPSGPPWTAMRPGRGGGNAVELVLALPVEGALPSSFQVPGHRTVTGLLPRRVERYVEVLADADQPDLLEDAPGGPLPHPAMLDLLDAFDGGAEGELRQVLVDPAAGHVDIAVTVRKLDE